MIPDPTPLYRLRDGLHASAGRRGREAQVLRAAGFEVTGVRPTAGDRSAPIARKP